MKRIVIILFLVMIMVTGCTSSTKEVSDMIKNGIITCAEKDKILNDDSTAILIDVREVNEYAEGHLDGAINISYTEIGTKISNYTTDKNRKIIVYCKSGKRSGIAYSVLKDQGFNNVYDLGSIYNCNS